MIGFISISVIYFTSYYTFVRTLCNLTCPNFVPYNFFLLNSLHVSNFVMLYFCVAFHRTRIRCQNILKYKKSILLSRALYYLIVLAHHFFFDHWTHTLLKIPLGLVLPKCLIVFSHKYLFLLKRVAFSAYT